MIRFFVAGVLLGSAFLWPSSWANAVLVCCAIFTLASAVKQESRIHFRSFFLFGVILNLIGFYWLPYTISTFGAFPYALAILLASFFWLLSGLQFVLCAFFLRLFARTFLARMELALPAAWLLAETLFPQLFPWRLCYSQIRWSAFASLAELVSTPLLSALLLWWGCVLYSFIFNWPKKSFALAFAFLLSLLPLAWGAWRNADLRKMLSQGENVSFALIQGNLDTDEKGDLASLEPNVARYRLLTEEAKNLGADIGLWPESVVISWLPPELKSVAGTSYDPLTSSRIPLLYGTLAFERRSLAEVEELQKRALLPDKDRSAAELGVKRYNAAVGIDERGAIIGRYFKRELLPFGEYLPLAERFPILKRLSPQSGDFAAGQHNAPLLFSYDKKGAEVNESQAQIAISPLICYEDLLPRLSREAANAGAEILVNLTNDAWYGHSAAPYQHHLLASWRAIETRRFLLRVTNTGLTAVVNPLGETLAQLPLFVADILLVPVKPLKIRTLAMALGEIPLWIVIALLLILSLQQLYAIRARKPKK